MNDDLVWRRPPEGTPERAPNDSGAAPEPAVPVYQGPPPTAPPPPDWRPRILIEAPPPRALPPQDANALDEREREARTVTLGVGMIAGAILLIVLFILCGRIIF